jgi:hypothetical protein
MILQLFSLMQSPIVGNERALAVGGVSREAR